MRPCNRRPVSSVTIGVALLAVTSAGAQNLTDSQVALISARLADGATHSWELGTRSETILELNATTYSVFSNNPLPPPYVVPSNLADALTPFFAIPHTIVTNRSVSNDNAQGAQPLIQDGSSGDPASIGMSVLLANWTGQDGGTVDYAGAARDQLDFLNNDVPKTNDGAISHRVSEVQLWSDSMYMVPPFLAYYGIMSENRTLLVQAYNQIRLYRYYLYDHKQSMWKHILLGTSGNDEGMWSTGNAWVAAGILRVLMTIRNSQYANTMKKEQTDLISWVHEIHEGVFPHLDTTANLLPNYADQPASAEGNFLDASSSALLASTAYRMAVIANEFTHIPAAERIRITLSSPNTTSSDITNTSSPLDGYTHFTSDGWLRPVVDPLSWSNEGSQSPEGQAFVVQMQAAWHDWVLHGARGANAAVSLRQRNVWVGCGVSMLLCLGILL